MRSQHCQISTSISNQLENQGYSAGFEVSLLLSGVQIITGLFFTGKALHTYPHDPRGENIPFQLVAEAKLHLTSHFRASPFGHPHLGFVAAPEAQEGTLGGFWQQSQLPGCQEMPFQHPFPSQHGGDGRYGGKAFPVVLFPNSQSHLTAPKLIRKQNLLEVEGRGQ